MGKMVSHNGISSSPPSASGVFCLFVFSFRVLLSSEVLVTQVYLILCWQMNKISCQYTVIYSRGPEIFCNNVIIIIIIIYYYYYLLIELAILILSSS
eukprot:gene8992-6314_t